MNHLIAQAGLEDKIICDSAGTASYHIGNAPDRRMSAAAQQRGIELRGKARQFTRNDFEAFDLILAMDRDNYEDICSLDSRGSTSDRAGKYQHKVRLMCDFCTRYTLKEVPDPYYGGPEGFDHVIDLLLDACKGLLAYIVTENLITR